MGRCPIAAMPPGPPARIAPFRAAVAQDPPARGPFPVPVAWRRLGLGLGDRRREVAQVAARWATFDCYGTLIDWEGGISGAFAELWPDADPLALLRAYHRIEPEVQRGRAISYRQVLGETLAGVATVSRGPGGAGGLAGARLAARHPLQHRPRPAGGIRGQHRRAGGRQRDRGRGRLLQARARPLAVLLRPGGRGPRPSRPRGGEPDPRHRAVRRARPHSGVDQPPRRRHRPLRRAAEPPPRRGAARSRGASGHARPAPATGVLARSLDGRPPTRHHQSEREGGPQLPTHEVRVDYSKTLSQQPETGHNRWHPDIPPVVRCDPGDEVILETRDAFDGQMGPTATLETVAAPNLNVVHPLTGSVYVNGAEAGDLLEIEILEVEPDRYGYTVQVPGFGFLRDLFPDPFMVRWAIAHGWASSDDLPGVRIPGAPFMGTIGLAPDRGLLEATIAREQAALDLGGFVLPPDTTDAVPDDAAIAREALRTIPPRETAGNVDIKQLSAGTRMFVPVYAEGGLFSAGDAHFAQGDCETCGTAIEMRATLHVRFSIHKEVAAGRGIRDLQFARDDYHVPPEFAAPRRFHATTGLSVTRDGENRPEDLTLAARNALLNMIDHLVDERGWTRQQAYAICSVAVDLKVSEVVDVPNFVVSAFLPLDVFTDR